MNSFVLGWEFAKPIIKVDLVMESTINVLTKAFKDNSEWLFTCRYIPHIIQHLVGRHRHFSWVPSSEQARVFEFEHGSRLKTYFREETFKVLVSIYSSNRASRTKDSDTNSYEIVSSHVQGQCVGATLFA
jgi:hypothetical protein